MNVFLDTNILYTDPFWKKTYPSLLLDAAKQEKVKLYISVIAFRELKYHTLKNFKRTRKALEKSIGENNDFRPLNLNIDISLSIDEEFDKYYQSIMGSYFQVIGYKNEFLPIVIEQALSKKRPFNDNKNEFKDFLIWVSYRDYIESSRLTDVFFITNNTNDFCQKLPVNEKSEEYALHPELIEGVQNIRVFNSIKGFFENVVKNLTTKTGKYTSWIKEKNFNAVYVFNLLIHQVHGVIENSVSNKIDASDLKKYFVEEREPIFECYIGAVPEWRNVELLNVEEIEDSILVSCIVNMETEIVAILEVKDRNENDSFIQSKEVSKKIKTNVYVSFVLDPEEKRFDMEGDIISIEIEKVELI